MSAVLQCCLFFPAMQPTPSAAKAAAAHSPTAAVPTATQDRLGACWKQHILFLGNCFAPHIQPNEWTTLLSISSTFLRRQTEGRCCGL